MYWKAYLSTIEKVHNWSKYSIVQQACCDKSMGPAQRSFWGARQYAQKLAKTWGNFEKFSAHKWVLACYKVPK